MALGLGWEADISFSDAGVLRSRSLGMRNKALDFHQEGDYNGDPIIEPEPSKGFETELKRLCPLQQWDSDNLHVLSSGLKRKSLSFKFRKFMTMPWEVGGCNSHCFYCLRTLSRLKNWTKNWAQADFLNTDHTELLKMKLHLIWLPDPKLETLTEAIIQGKSSDSTHSRIKLLRTSKSQINW